MLNLRVLTGALAVGLLSLALPAQGRAFLIDSDVDKLFSVDLENGLTSPIGSTLNNGLTRPADLTWQPDTRQLWTIDFDGGELGTVDMFTGTFTKRYNTGITGWQALAWDPVTRLFFLATSSQVYALNLATSSMKPLGTPGVGIITSLQIGQGGVLYGVEYNGKLFTVDKGTGAATLLSTTLVSLQGLSIDGNGRWYATCTNDNSLYRINMATGAATLVGLNVNVQFAKGFQILPRPDPNTAYVVDSGVDKLFEVSLTTGAATYIADTDHNALATPAALAWRDDLAEMWTIDLNGRVGILDLVSGGFAWMFDIGMTGWQGMAWDPLTKRFYLSNQNDSIYVLDPATGSTTLLGDSGMDLITALEADVDGSLYGIDLNSSSLVLCDKTTGAATVVAGTSSYLQGLAQDDYGLWYATNTSDDSLYRIDMRTGTATLIGPHGAGINMVKGFEIVTQSIMRHGVGCTDSGGVQLRMLWQGTAEVGDDMLLSCRIRLGGRYSLLFGTSNQYWAGGSLPFSWGPLAPGCSIYQSTQVVIGQYPLGSWCIFTTPRDPAFVGHVLFVQGMELDPGANPFGLVFSDYIRLVFSM